MIDLIEPCDRGYSEPCERVGETRKVFAIVARGPYIGQCAFERDEKDVDDSENPHDGDGRRSHDRRLRLNQVQPPDGN